MEVLEKQLREAERKHSLTSTAQTKQVMATTTTTTPAERTPVKSIQTASSSRVKLTLSDDVDFLGSSSPTNGSIDPIAMEKISSRIAHKDREILSLRSQMSDLETSRQSIADELVLLVQKNEELAEETKEMPALKQKQRQVFLEYDVSCSTC